MSMKSLSALARADLAMRHYDLFEGGPPIELSQALADLMVWAESRGVSFEEAMKAARDMHAECDQ